MSEPLSFWNQTPARQAVLDYDAGAEKAQQLAAERNWQVISMQQDFVQVFTLE